MKCYLLFIYNIYIIYKIISIVLNDKIKIVKIFVFEFNYEYSILILLIDHVYWKIELYFIKKKIIFKYKKIKKIFFLNFII